MSPNQAIVFAVIAGIVERGDACPPNRDIAEMAGIPFNTTTSAIEGLKSARKITVENFGKHGRVITIVDTGEQTAWPEMVQRVAKPSDSFSAILPPPRDPCWKCGTRMDIGCEHQRWAA